MDTLSSSILLTNTYCPHISSHFLNSHLTTLPYSIALPSSSSSSSIPFIPLYLYSSPSLCSHHLPLSYPINLIDSYYLSALTSDWTAINNTQSLDPARRNKEGCIFALHFDTSGEYFASSNHDSAIEIWSTRSKRIVKSIHEHKETVTGMEFFHSNNKRLLSCSLDKTIKLFDNYKLMHTFTEHCDWVRCISISHNDKYFLSGCVSSVIKLWDLHRKTVISSIVNKQANADSLSTVNSLSFSKDDNLFLTGLRTGEVKLFDKRVSSTHNNTLCVFRAHDNKLNSVRFNNNDKYLLTSGRDALIRLWDMRKLPSYNAQQHNTSLLNVANNYIRQYKGHKCSSYNIESNFYGNDRYIMAASIDGDIYFYDTNTEKVKRKLTTGLKSVILCKPIPNSYGIAFTGLEDISISIWEPKRNITRAMEVNAAKRNEDAIDKELLFDDGNGNVSGNDNDDVEDRLSNDYYKICSKILEEIMSEYSESILKIFHENNIAFSNGVNFQQLLEIIEQNRTTESVKILNLLNEKIIKSLNECLMNSVMKKNNVKENKKGNEEGNKENVVKGNNVKCVECKGGYKEDNRMIKGVGKGMLELPNKVGFKIRRCSELI